jgi:SAM-dependent methyltransferase
MTGQPTERPDYGIDSPAMVIGELALAGVAGLGAWLLFALGNAHLFVIPLWGISLAIGVYLLIMAVGMLDYSLRGKLRIRDQMLRSIAWSGHERVLDVGCGRGLLLVGAAQRLTDGNATGVDRWVRGAVSGNGPQAVLRNAELASVADRVDVCDCDARELPFPDEAFDVALSNFVLHELDTPVERAQMLSEIARILKPGGRVALVDFIFTGEAERTLRAQGMEDVRREPAAGWIAFASFALLTFGLGRLYLVTGVKGEGMSQHSRDGNFRQRATASFCQ